MSQINLYHGPVLGLVSPPIHTPTIPKTVRSTSTTQTAANNGHTPIHTGVTAANKNRGPVTKWTDPQIELMLTSMVQQQRTGRKGVAGFSKVAHEAAVSVITAETGTQYTVQQIKNKLSDMKAIYHEWLRLPYVPELGWDAEKGMVNCGREVWMTYIKEHPKARMFYDSPLKWVSEQQELFAGSPANPVSVRKPRVRREGLGAEQGRNGPSTEGQSGSATSPSFWSLVSPVSPSSAMGNIATPMDHHHTTPATNHPPPFGLSQPEPPKRVRLSAARAICAGLSDLRQEIVGQRQMLDPVNRLQEEETALQRAIRMFEQDVEDDANENGEGEGEDEDDVLQAMDLLQEQNNAVVYMTMSKIRRRKWLLGKVRRGRRSEVK